MRGDMLGQCTAAIVLLLALSAALGWGRTSNGAAVDRAAVNPGVRNLRRVPGHASEFLTLSEPLEIARCADTRPPEALATPDPLLQLQDENLQVRVSFIVGTDGQVHSPFILESGGPAQDQVVLGAVRHWRYRPALCNGVPTESEARIEFSIR